MSPLEFDSFVTPLTGLPLTRLWQGYGSAIFLEFGNVQPRRRQDGSPGNARGEWTLGVPWSWRIEGKRLIWCGSWSDGERWPRAFARIEGQRLSSLSLYGRLPEIDASFENGIHLLSMMTAEGGPEWHLSNHVTGVSVEVRAGRLWREPERADIVADVNGTA